MIAINDADAAGLAELRYGAARDVAGTVLLLTLGTGIGGALFIDGGGAEHRVGHVQVAGREAEKRASARQGARRFKLGRLGKRTEFSHQRMHSLLWPDLIVLCGGITEEPEISWINCICEARLCVGALRSEAGIVGAAWATTLSPKRR